MKWNEIDRRLRAAGFGLFSDREYRAVAGATAAAAKFQLIRYTRRGLLTRLKRGLYAATDRMPPPWVVANRLTRPSYVSLSSALAYWGLVPEAVYAVTSVTTRATREFEAAGRLYVYRTIKRAAFGGYGAVSVEGQTVLVAEKEKAVADHLYFVFLGKELLNDRLAFDRVERRKVAAHVHRFGHVRFLRWFQRDLKVPDRRAAG